MKQAVNRPKTEGAFRRQAHCDMPAGLTDERRSTDEMAAMIEARPAADRAPMPPGVANAADIDRWQSARQ